MNKRIVICSDGTWNRPERDIDKDTPTNVLRMARAVKPIAKDKVPQQVFYDWGVGSDASPIAGGITGKGLHKNIMDAYRYIVQNYADGDEIFLFGFSRGAYTVRSLCGLINNCGILKRADARLIQAAFDHYKKSSKPYAPKGKKSLEFRAKHSHRSREVAFVGVWDTVGAMGIPISFLGLMDDKDEFYDTKIGSNVRVARHALAIDEQRRDFEPTIWLPREDLDLRQVWFSGVHSDVGGSYKPDKDGSLLSDIPLAWMMTEASVSGLSLEPHLKKELKASTTATLHKSRRNFYRLRATLSRPIEHGQGDVLLHRQVKQRCLVDSSYRPDNLVSYIESHGWPAKLER
jgi:uncharacterized protein (DUF2235 family)